MMRSVLLLFAASACSYTAPGGTPSTDGTPPPPDGAEPDPDSAITTDTAGDSVVTGPFLTGFTYRKPITITRATGTETLIDFPVGIVIPQDSEIAQHALASGADLVVTTDDAVTRLDSELAGYTSATGATELWVRVPSLSSGTTTLFLYYGSTATTTNPAAVWGSLFKGVWHLSDPAGSTSANDSTAADHDIGQSVTAAVPVAAAGVAGLGRQHDGVDDRFELADPVDGSLDVGTSSFSFSIWVNATANVGQFDQPIFKGGTSNGNPGYCFMLGTGSWSAKLHDGTDFINANFAAAPINNQWVHLAAVVDRSGAQDTAAAYVNGTRISIVNFALGSFNSPNDFRIGEGSGGAAFEGFTDEARIYNGALTADWIAAEHENLTRDGFLVVGGEQSQQ